jgi:hypothetical protein
VDERAVEEGIRLPLSSPETVPLGGRGQPYFGSGWRREGESPSRRLLPPGRAQLFLPLEREAALDLDLEFPPDGGELRVNGEGPVHGDAGTVRFALSPRAGRGLQAIDVEWRGSSPLVVTGIRTVVVP